MGPLNFLNGLFLIGLAAAAAPIIIHLVQRRRVQRVVFGSVRFLRKMSNRVVRRRRFTELLLILLRVAALALLALAFARPVFWRDTDDSGRIVALGEEAVLVLVDNSYSMSARGRLDKAKTAAREYIDDLRASVKVGVATFASACEVACPIGADRSKALDAVDDIEQSWAGTDLHRALSKAQARLLAGSAQKLSIVVFSDFQKSSYQFADRGTRRSSTTAPATRPAAPDALERLLAEKAPDQAAGLDWRLKPGIELIVKDVAADEFANVYVKRVKAPQLALAGGLPQVITAEIVNRTDKPLSNVPVVLTLGGKEAGRDSVNIRPNSETYVRFRCSFTDPGDVAGTVTIQLDPKRKIDDELAADNTGWFCVPVKPKVRVLLVNGDPDPTLSRNDGFFISKALAPNVAETLSPFEIRELVPAKLKAADLSGISAVLLANVDAVPPPAAAALRTFLASGGGVGFFLGAKVTVGRFNTTFAGLAPCKLYGLALRDGDDPVRISLIDFKHEAFQEFAGPRRGDFARASFRQYFLVKESQAARKLARFNNGHAALLEERIGKGRSLLFVSAADVEWNDLWIKSIFAPFIHELTRHLCGQRAGGGERNHLVGRKITHWLAPADKDVSLRGPDGKKLDLEINTGRGERAQRSVEFTPATPGVYELACAGAPARYAANIAPGEPDPVRLDTRVLAAKLQSDPEGAERQPGGGAIMPPETPKEAAESRQKIWMFLLALMLLALAAEMIIAAWTGTS